MSDPAFFAFATATALLVSLSAHLQVLLLRVDVRRLERRGRAPTGDSKPNGEG